MGDIYYGKDVDWKVIQEKAAASKGTQEDKKNA